MPLVCYAVVLVLASRPDSTTAKFFARNCLCEIRMVGHEWFHWILSLVSPSQWVELNSTHWRSEFFAREERIQWNYSCATIRISHKQFLAKYFAVVESGLNIQEINIFQKDTVNSPLKSIASTIISTASLIETSSSSPTDRMIGAVSLYSRKTQIMSLAKSWKK